MPDKILTHLAEEVDQVTGEAITTVGKDVATKELVFLNFESAERQRLSLSDMAQDVSVGNTLFVDLLTPAGTPESPQNGTITRPFSLLPSAIAVATPNNLIRVAPNADSYGDINLSGKTNLLMLTDYAKGMRLANFRNLSIFAGSQNIGMGGIAVTGTYINQANGVYLDNPAVQGNSTISGINNVYDDGFFHNITFTGVGSTATLRNTECQENSIWTVDASVTTGTIVLRNCTNVTIVHQSGNLEIDGCTFVGVGDNVAILSTCPAGSGSLKIYGSTRLGSLVIKKTGDCPYSLGNTQYNEVGTELNGVRTYDNLQADQVNFPPESDPLYVADKSSIVFKSELAGLEQEPQYSSEKSSIVFKSELAGLEQEPQYVADKPSLALKSEIVTSYNGLSDRPYLSGTMLQGNVTLADIGAQPAGDYALNVNVYTTAQIDTKLSTKADLDETGTVPEHQLPSYVDDVVSVADFASLPVSGLDGKIYVTEADNKTYRWSGSSYVQLDSGLALGETSATAYRGDRGKSAYDHSQLIGNPHGTTKTDIGLSNVDNTSDNDKPLSTAAVNALAQKADITSLQTHTGNIANPHSVTKQQVGLGSVDNTSDINKPVSTAQQLALNLKADVLALNNHTGDINNPHDVTKAQVGLGSVDNTTDLGKPVSVAQQAALDLKADKSDTYTKLEITNLLAAVPTHVSAYGAIYLAGGTVAQSIPANTTVKVTGFTANDINSGVVVDHTTDSITISTPGVYSVSFTVTAGALSTNGREMAFKLYKQGAPVPSGEAHQIWISGVDVNNVNLECLVQCAAGDVLDIRASHNRTTALSFTPTYLNLSVFKV